MCMRPDGNSTKQLGGVRKLLSSGANEQGRIVLGLAISKELSGGKYPRNCMYGMS